MRASLVRYLTIALIVCGVSGAQAATFYIAANGSDSNTGTNKTTPWLHAPGMPKCSGSCASELPQPGDQFILRGGDTWHFGNQSASPYVGVQTISGRNWGWVWQTGWDGTSSNPIYIGVDQTWYNSSACGSSWCRPILNGDNPASSVGVSSCTYDESTLTFLAINSRSHIIVDNLEFTGICWGGDQQLPYSGGNICCAAYVSWNTGLAAPGNLLENLYFHGWSHIKFSSPCSDPPVPGQTCDGATWISGTSNTNLGGGDTIANVVCDGSDTDHQSSACVFGDGYEVRNSIFRYATDGLITNNTHLFHDNLVEYVNFSGDGASHPNGVEFNVEFTGVNAVYNNIIRHLWTDGRGCGVSMWETPRSTDYIFNNLEYDTTCTGNYWNLVLDGTTTFTANVFNNTFVIPVQGAIAGPPAGTTVNFYNNHCIMPSGGTSSACSTYKGTESYLSDLVQTTTLATTQGYTPAENYAYAPPAGGSTIGTGTNLQSYCNALSGAGLSAAATACQSSTTYACTYDTVNHRVSCATGIAAARPTSGAWDVGAYQSSTVLIQPTQPPAVLTATVH